MFDQQHRDVALVADAADQVAQDVHFLVVEAAGRLVEQQDLGFRRQRAAEFDALLGPERKPRDLAIVDAMQIEIGQDLVDLRVERALLAAHPRQLQRVADHVAVGAAMPADADVVAHRQAREQRHVLEGASDADLGDLRGLTAENAHAFHQNVALARLIEPAQTIEQRRLACAVRTDQAKDLTLLHLERHAIQRHDAAEHDAETLDREQRPRLNVQICAAHAFCPPLEEQDDRCRPVAGRRRSCGQHDCIAVISRNVSIGRVSA